MTLPRPGRWIVVASTAAAMSLAALLPATAVRAPGLPALGTDPSTVDPASVPGAVSRGDGSMVPLRAARPVWMTPSMLRRVHAARGRPVAVPDRIAAAATIERGIRPGSLMVAPYGCTMNFVFRRNGDRAIGTAGHCVDRVDQRVVVMVRNPEGDVVVVSVGRVGRRALNERGVAPDFALVRIRERLEDWAAPAITSIGGPCGIFRGGGIQTLWHYGYPLAAAGAERVGISLSWRDAGYEWAGAAISGDSGSPVRTGSYAAAGNLTHFGASPTGNVFGTRMTWIEDFVAPWRLALSPGCD